MPALETHDAAPEYITESAAIAHFVADSGSQRERLLGATVGERGRVQQWIFHSEHEIFPPVLTAARTARGLVPFVQEADDAATAAFERVLKTVEAHLATEKYLAGTAQSSLADFTVAGALFWAWKFWKGEEYRAQYPNVIAWYKRIIESEEAREIFGPADFKA